MRRSDDLSTKRAIVYFALVNLLFNLDVVGSQSTPKNILYRNARYNFDFSLPQSWKGFSILMESWGGGSAADNKVVSGPSIVIRHPEWNEKEPRQDIPILIFTHQQWNALEREEFHIGAAPFGPSKLGSNARYVFALPARYNYAFPVGFEEVDAIIRSHPLHAH